MFTAPPLCLEDLGHIDLDLGEVRELSLQLFQ